MAFVRRATSAAALRNMPTQKSIEKARFPLTRRVEVLLPRGKCLVPRGRSIYKLVGSSFILRQSLVGPIAWCPGPSIRRQSVAPCGTLYLRTMVPLLSYLNLVSYFRQSIYVLMLPQSRCERCTPHGLQGQVSSLHFVRCADLPSVSFREHPSREGKWSSPT